MQLALVPKLRAGLASAAAVAVLWCGQANAQVLDQVPSDALAIVKIKSLEKTNTKVAKLAKTFGLDEIEPQSKDPLAALLEKGHISKGIDKSGEAALVIFGPEKQAGHEEPVAVALVPVSDFDAFVSNFKKSAAAAPAGAVAVSDPDNGTKTLFIAKRGSYAVMSDKASHLSAKAGLKLSPAIQKESDAKDLIFIANMPAIRALALPQLKEHRGEIIKELDKELAQQEMFKPFIPVFDSVVNKVLDTAEEVLNDADGAAESLNITDTGIIFSVVVDFKPTSRFGTTVAAARPESGHTLLAGLPNQKYFAYGGGVINPQAIQLIIKDWIDPTAADLKKTDSKIGQDIAKLLETFKEIAPASHRSAFGWVAPTKGLGQESLFQTVSVAYGDADALVAGEKKVFTIMNDLLAQAPQQGVKSKIELGEVKHVGDAELQSFSNKMEFDPNDPRGAQAQQMLALLYGPNGQTGVFGAVGKKAFVAVSGADDEQIKAVIEAAKADKDVLSDQPNVKTVSALFPGHPSFVAYLQLDTVVSTAVRYAQGFGLPIKLKLPENLAPIGLAVGSDASAIRVDVAVPVDTVQSLIAAGLQAYNQMQKGQQGGGL